MTIEAREFWRRVIQSGLADKQECRQIVKSFHQSKERSQDSGLTGLAQFLVQSGWLTPFQHDALLADPPLEFRIGRFVLRDQSAPAPFRSLVPVAIAQDSIGTSTSNPSERARTSRQFAGVLLRTVKVPEAQGEHWYAPYKELKTPNLQSYEMDDLDDCELVFSPLDEGTVLADSVNQGKPISRARVCEYGESIATALSAMHAKGLVHGSVRTDRVWVHNQSPNPVQLLFDPTVGVLDELESPVFSMAPETILSGSAPTAQTDIYALGCLLFTLTTGERPFHGASDDAIQQMHVHVSPDALRLAIEEGDQGDPLMRVLAYAMAKEPTARFQTVDQFGKAIAAVAETLAPSPVAAVRPPEPKKDGPETETIATPESESERETQPTQEPVSEPATSDPPKPKSKKKPASPSEDQPDWDPHPKRRRFRKRNHASLVLAGLASIVMMQIVYLAMVDPPPRIVKRRRPRPPIPKVIPAVSSRSNRLPSHPKSGEPPTPGETKESAPDRQYVIRDDDRLLYTPPYAGSNTPVELNLLPPGPSLLVSVDGSMIFDDSIQWMNSIDQLLLPAWRTALTNIATRIKVPHKNIKRLTIALYPGDREELESALSVQLQDPVDFDRLVKNLKVSKARTKDGATLFSSDEVDADAYYFLESDNETETGRKQITAFAQGSVQRISDLAAIDGETIPLPRTMETLWKATDVDADICIMTTPNFLFADGRILLEELTPRLIDPLRQYLIPDVSALLIVLDEKDDRFYAEWRVAAAGAVNEISLSRSMRKSVDRWPGWAESIAARQDHPDPLVSVANRFPTIANFVSQRTRTGVSRATATANVYLPLRPLPQLAFATLYAAGLPEREASAEESIAKSLTLDEMLALKMSVSFDAEDMQPAFDVVLDALAEQLPDGAARPVLTIQGGDLQLKGITQNQQIRKFSKTDVPFREVLTALVVAANTDKTASGPSDSKQILIWAIERLKNGEEEDGKEGVSEIVITTRDAAGGGVYEIPPEFVLKSDSP